MASTRLENVALASTLEKPIEQTAVDMGASDLVIHQTEQNPVTHDTFTDVKIYESIDEFHKNLPPTVTRLQAPNGNNGKQLKA
jgi:hypothetical protein